MSTEEDKGYVYESESESNKAEDESARHDYGNSVGLTDRNMRDFNKHHNISQSKVKKSLLELEEIEKEEKKNFEGGDSERRS